MNSQPVKDAQEASAAIAKQDLSKGIRFDIVRPDGSGFVFVEPDIVPPRPATETGLSRRSSK